MPGAAKDAVSTGLILRAEHRRCDNREDKHQKKQIQDQIIIGFRGKPRHIGKRRLNIRAEPFNFFLLFLILSHLFQTFPVFFIKPSDIFGRNIRVRHGIYVHLRICKHPGCLFQNRILGRYLLIIHLHRNLRRKSASIFLITFPKVLDCLCHLFLRYQSGYGLLLLLLILDCFYPRKFHHIPPCICLIGSHERYGKICQYR